MTESDVGSRKPEVPNATVSRQAGPGRVLRLATRRSALALAQADIVAGELARLGVEAEIVPVVTTGDRDRTSAVTTLTEVGAFVRAVQTAVLDGRADVAVHSGKDLPVGDHQDLVRAHPRRGTPWDVLAGASLTTLPAGAKVGTGSPRRSAQLRLLRPDVEVVGIRGNVGTRLDKVAAGKVAAVVLAEAGLDRLNRLEAVRHRFSLAEMVPAPAQAALTLECLDDSDVGSILAELEHPETARALQAERGLLEATGAGCRSALGALAQIEPDGSIRFDGFVEDERGPRRGAVSADDPAQAVERLRRELAL